MYNEIEPLVAETACWSAEYIHHGIEKDMPAIDRCEPQIIHALEKDGWLITHQPFAIRIDKTRGGYIFADIRLHKPQTGQSAIVVEVKCFESTRTFLDEFYHAVGQYIVYRNALLLNDISSPVYLAIPSNVFQNFFQQALIKAVLRNTRINLVVIDLEKEELAQWIS